MMFSITRRTLLALAMLLSFAVLAIQPLARASQQPPVSFALRSIDGPTVTSESLQGEVVVLAFGATWLPLTRKQVQGVRKLADQYSRRGVVVYWVSADSESSKSKNFASDEELRAFAKKNDLTVTILRDPDGEIAKQLGVNRAGGLPAIVILDKQGRVHGAPIGGLDPDGDLTKQLADPLAQVLGN